MEEGSVLAFRCVVIQCSAFVCRYFCVDVIGDHILVVSVNVIVMGYGVGMY